MKEKQAFTLVGVERGTYFTPLSSRGDECDELWIQPPPTASVRNATAAEQLGLQRSGPGFSLAVTQDGPQFRTQRLGQTSRRYSLSLRMICSFSMHCIHALASLLPIFAVSPLLHPHLSCSSFTFLTSFATSSLSPIIIISVPTDFV